MRPLVYIAGPITHGDSMHENAIRACRVAERVWDAGMAPVVPHFDVFWQEAEAKRTDHPDEALSVCYWSYEDFLELDFCYILRCDALLRMEGYSPGSDREILFCEENGIPVFYHLENLIEWATPFMSEAKDTIRS